MIKSKVTLYRLNKESNKWDGIDSGYLNPNPPEIGKSVWVGSLTSRDGWTTTEVIEVTSIKNGYEFKTKNSLYRVVPLFSKIDEG